MSKFRLLFAVLVLTLLAVSAAVPTQAAPGLPTPCLGDSPNVYLVISGQRDHIVDWDTFLNLGYKPSDIDSCTLYQMVDPLGEPITRLFKGSTPPVYWLKDGVRYHIPDMATFTALGFQTSQITVLPDSVIALWSLGADLPSTTTTTTSGDTVYDQETTANYTISLWHPAQGLTNYATISKAGQADVRIDDVASIGGLPVASITGDGLPDLEFLTKSDPGSGHCCWGTQVYELGTAATNILSVESPAYQIPGTGQGAFQDLNGDNVYQFIVQDPLDGIGCSQPNVTAILTYSAASKHYVPSSPHFTSYYNSELPQLAAQAAAGDHCSVYPLIETLLYEGNLFQANLTFAHYYKGADAAAYWSTLITSAHSGRFYTSGS